MSANTFATPNIAGTTSAAPAGSVPQQFGDWLENQLASKRMTQRQLADRSGVDHSTISRLMRGDRVPSLETAQRLATGLREPLFGVTSGEGNPIARVEHALRADKILSESQIRALMSQYLLVRQRDVAQAAAMAAKRAAIAPPVLVRR